MRPPVPPTWIDLAASSSRCARTIPIARSPSGPGTTNVPRAAERRVVLGDLVALGQVGIEVVLAVEDRVRRDLAAEREAELHGPVHGLAVEHGQRAGMREADRAGARVRLGAPLVRAAAEHLRARLQLHVDLEADDGFPGHCEPPGDEVEAERGLERMADLEEAVLGELRAEDLQADGEPVRQAARNREPRQPGHVRRDREHVREVHGQRVLGLLPEAERHRRRRRAEEHVEVLEGGGELVLDHRPHLLRLAVVGVVVAGRERVGAEHDAALGLLAEALPAGALVQLGEVALDVGAQAVAHAVVAGQVRARLRGSDEVVAGHPVLDRARQRRLADLGAELLGQADRGVHRLGDAGLDALGLVQLLRDADADALEVLARGQRDRLGQLDRGRVLRVVAGDDLVEPGVVADGLRHRTDLVEARREGDDPVAADRSVGGPQADDPAQRGGLLDRAARVGAERPRRQAAGDRGRRAARRAAGNALGIPRVLRRARRRSSRSRSPSRTRPGSSCRAAAGLRPSRARPRWSRTPGCSPRGSSRRPSSGRPSS